MSAHAMKIGELAKLTGSAVETIRYYEKEGLLPTSARSEGNYRMYSAQHLERLQFIRRCRSLDMTLSEIRNLLAFKDAPDESCISVNDLLDQHIKHVSMRITELEGLRIQLKALRGLCLTAHASKDCEILQSLGSTDGVAVSASLSTRRNYCGA